MNNKQRVIQVKFLSNNLDIEINRSINTHLIHVEHHGLEKSRLFFVIV